MNEWQEMQYDRYADPASLTGCQVWAEGGPRHRNKPCIYDGPAGKRTYVAYEIARDKNLQPRSYKRHSYRLSCGNKQCVAFAHVVERYPPKRRGVVPIRKCDHCPATKAYQATDFTCARCKRTLQDLASAIDKDNRTFAGRTLYSTVEAQLKAREDLLEMFSRVLSLEPIREP